MTPVALLHSSRETYLALTPWMAARSSPAAGRGCLQLQRLSRSGWGVVDAREVDAASVVYVLASPDTFLKFAVPIRSYFGGELAPKVSQDGRVKLSEFDSKTPSILTQLLQKAC